MSVILNPPSTVLLVPATDVPDRLERAVLAGEATALEAIATAEAVTDAIGSRDDVGCAVIVREHGDDAAALARSVRSADEDLPVVFYDGSATDDETATVLPQVATPADLRDAVDEALETYRRRRRSAEESEMLRGMLEHLGTPVYFKDTEGRVLHMADVGGGPDPERARGKTDPEIFGEGTMAELAFKDDLQVVEDNRVVEREERVPDAGRWMQTTKVPWRDANGRVRGLVGLTVDITERKRREHQLDELRHRFNTFTSQLRHELKTQLQIAMGRLPRGDGVDAEAVAGVEDALEEIDRVVEDYGRLAKRSITIGDEHSPASLVAATEDAWAAVDPDGVTLTVDAPEDTCVNATNAMVRSVVENLFREVTTRAREGATVRVGTTEDGFYVEDTTRAVPESRRAVIEQPGFAAAQDGSGRELSIVKDEMDKHVWSLALGEGPDGHSRLEVENCLVDVHDEPSERDGDPRSLTETAAVGRLQCEGSVHVDEGLDRWYVAADGNDIYRQDNDFFFVYATVAGDTSIQGRVRDVEHVKDFSKGGFMIRHGLSADASYAYVGQTAGAGTEVLWRAEPGTHGESRQVNDRAFGFEWYRLDRVGDEVVTYLSMDGRHWQAVDRRRLQGGDPVQVGVVVCSALPGEVCEAVFEAVDVRARSNGGS